MRTRGQALQAILVATGMMGLTSACNRTVVVTSELDHSVPAPTPSATIDSVPPTITAFTIPSTATSSTIPVSSFAATDNVGVTGYLLTETSTAPLASTGGWNASAPTIHTFTGIPQGIATSKTLYAWAKDAAGNVSNVASASMVITLPSSIPQPSIKSAVLDYTQASAAQLAWMNKFFALKVGGKNPGNPQMVWMGYYDIHGPGSLSEFLIMKDWAAANQVDPERVLIHAKQNFTSIRNPAWSQMDKFDKFEGANGVLLETSPNTFTDKTTVAYSGASPFTSIGSNLYLGYEEPFALAKFDVRTPGVALAGAWQYWNGSAWSSLSVSDGTANMTATGAVSFVPPSNWKRKSINNSRNKYFIRFLFTSATTVPVINTIKGDDWLNGSGSACRGWAATSGTIVNAGTPLEYNPTPPAGASAKFPYQARITYWAANHFIANPADFQTIGGTSRRTWAQFLAFRTNQLAEANSWSGLMGDDGDPGRNLDGIDYTLTDFVDYSANSWATEITNKYQDTVNAFRLLNPTAKFGLNGQRKAIVQHGDWSLAEYHTFVRQTASLRCITVGDASTSSACYDDYLPENNPRGIFSLLIYDDTVATLPVRSAWAASKSYTVGSQVKATVGSIPYWFTCTQAGTSSSAEPSWKIDGSPIADGTATWVYGGGFVEWDRAHRGPITALSKHLIAANNSTYFSYYSRGGFIYSETDAVVLKNGSVAHLATDPIPPLSDVQRWGTWFPAMAVDFGTPDSNGWNGGERSFTWKLGANLGGGPDVWRRDYTKAIVLHRAAYYLVTAEQLSTFSSMIELGGTYYPLKADGTTGPGISSIALRYNEGAILMKEPIYSNSIFSMAQ